MIFSATLISWYEANKRDLPFRGTKDPYLIWVSEVILQQTRMEQGVPYYLRFIHQFPDILRLAAAPEEQVLKTWQGRGYYSRARNLHATAREIVEKYEGHFPASYDQILKLKGIGEYSAASITSLAFDEPRAAIDGNVYRLLSRFFGIREAVGSVTGRKLAKAKAEMLMDPTRPGQFNQAMIEYGALVCTPQKPACNGCLFNETCYAFRHGLTQEIPVRKKKTAIRNRFFYYLVITFGENGELDVIVNKREGKDIWRNLYDFPLIESTTRLTSWKLMKSNAWKEIFRDRSPEVLHVSEEFRHVLSHQTIMATFYNITLKEAPDGTGIHLPLSLVETFPFPALITKYWQKYFQ